MSENGRDLIEQMHQEAVERLVEEKARAQFRGSPPTVRELRTIHFSELPDAKPDSPLFREWNCYRREVARLLAEGNEGRWVLIKGEEIVGIWQTHDDARAVALQNYLMQPCLIHQILSREPILRGPTAFWRCQR